MMTPADIRSTDRLPPQITGQLRAMVQRVRRIIVLRGLLTSTVVLLGCSLAIMAIDAGIMILSAWVRWALSLSAFTVVAATTWRSLLQPLSRPLSLTRMARVLETRHPELQERISSALELLSMGGSAGATGSAQLIKLLAHDAEADMNHVTPRGEFTSRSLKPVLRGGTVILGVFILLFALWPRQTSLLFARSLLPGANLAGLQAYGLQVDPGDALREEGAELTIRLKVEGREQARAELHTETASGTKDIERMSVVSPEATEPAIYEIAFPMVTESFRYRIRYGTGLTRFYDVTVLPRPAATRMMITCQYPDYTRREDVVLPEGKRDIVGLAGGRVTIEADFNRAADGLVLLGDRPVEGAAHKEPGATWTFDLSTNMPPRWGIALRDVHGFSNHVEWAALSAVPDRAPRVVLHTPKLSKLVLPPRGTLPIACLINEDFGLAEHEIVIESMGTDTPVLRRYPLTLTSVSEEEWSGNDEIDMARLDIGDASQFRFWVSLTDTLPPDLGGPQKASSRAVEITLDENAKSIKEQEREQQLAELVKLLTSAVEILGKAADGVASVESQTAVDPLPSPVVVALAAASEQSGSALGLVVDAVTVCAASRFESLAPRVAWVAQKAVAPAWETAKEIPDAEAAQRPARCETAVKTLRVAAERVLQLIKVLDELNAALDKQDRLEDLTDRELALANQARNAMTAEEMEEWLKKQKELLDELKKTALLEGSKARNLMQQAMQEMQNARDRMLPPSKDDLEERQKKETEEPKGQDSKGAGGKGGKQNPGDDKKEHKPPTSHKLSKGKGMGKGAAGGEGMTPGTPGTARESQLSAADMAQSAAEAMSTYLPKAGAAAAAAVSGKGQGKGGSSLMPGSETLYIPGTFDGGISDADWAKIKGSSDAGATSDELRSIPPEYRGLARKYFIELSREGARRIED